MSSEMTLNGFDIGIYNARLLNYSVSGTAVSNNISSAGERLCVPALYGTTLAPRTLTVSLTFFPRQLGADSRNTGIVQRLARAAENITRFESEIIGKTVEIGLPDGYYYTALVSSLPAPSFDATGLHDVTYTFFAVRHLNEETVLVRPGSSLTCLSNTKTAFQLVMTVPGDYEALTVCGITVRNISAGSELIIDSVNGLISCNGENKFNDTDFIDFPYLQAGKNIIDCTAPDAAIKIIYTPVLA